MKFTFKKKNDAVTAARNSIWEKFEQANLRLQHRCAQWLERKTAHFSKLNWMVILLAFVVSTGGLSMYLIAAGLSGNTTKNSTAIPIMKPVHWAPLKEKPVELHPIISKTELEKVTHFRWYLDSLNRSATGKKTHDSILLNRPGLLDSLLLLENY